MTNEETMLAVKAIVRVLIGRSLPVFTRSAFAKHFRYKLIASKLLTELITEDYIRRVPSEEVKRLKWKQTHVYLVAEPKLELVHMILATKEPWPVVKEWFTVYTADELLSYLKANEEGPHPVV